jgi:hypothetical protein
LHARIKDKAHELHQNDFTKIFTFTIPARCEVFW